MAELYVHEACDTGKLDLLKQLVEEGADASEVDPNTGSLPIHWAARGGHVACVEYLLHHKLNDVNAKNGIGNTPLHFAAVSGTKGVSKLLLERGAFINAKNNSGQAPLHGAVGQAWDHVVECLHAFRKEDCKNCAHSKCYSHILDLNCKDQNGWTPLHYAARHVGSTTYNLLLKLGADPNICNKFGELPVPPFQRWWKLVTMACPILLAILIALVALTYNSYSQKLELREWAGLKIGTPLHAEL